MFALFSAVNHLSGPLRKHKFTSMGSKGYSLICDWWTSICFVLCVSVFEGSLLVIIIMIDSSENRDFEGSFRTSEFECF